MKSITTALASNTATGRAIRSAIWAGVSVAALPFATAILTHVISNPTEYSAGIVAVCMFLLEAITSVLNPKVKN